MKRLILRFMLPGIMIFLIFLILLAHETARAQTPVSGAPASEPSMQADPSINDIGLAGDQEPPPNESSSPAAVAAAAYARGDWDTAIAQYRAMQAEGYVNPALFYNLGTAYARSGQKGYAVWMFLKALKLDPRDASIRRNLALVAPDLNTQRALFPVPPMEALYRGLRLNEWAWIGGVGTVVSALAFALFLAMRPMDRRRRWLRRLAIAAGLLAVGGHGFAAAGYYEQEIIARGVITDPETQPRSAPSESSDVYTFTLPPGTLIRVQNAGTEGWIKAIYGGSNEVFIRDSQYERL